MTLENEDKGREDKRPVDREHEFQFAGLPARVPDVDPEHDSSESLADELEDRVDQALEGDIASADDVKDAFRS